MRADKPTVCIKNDITGKQDVIVLLYFAPSWSKRSGRRHSKSRVALNFPFSGEIEKS